MVGVVRPWHLDPLQHRGLHCGKSEHVFLYQLLPTVLRPSVPSMVGRGWLAIKGRGVPLNGLPWFSTARVGPSLGVTRAGQ